MLLFAECDNDHNVPCDDQWRKYAKVEYGEYAKYGVYIAKSKHSEYAKQHVHS
jgi:hypothetical protein